VGLGVVVWLCVFVLVCFGYWWGFFFFVLVLGVLFLFCWVLFFCCFGITKIKGKNKKGGAEEIGRRK
jgi:hypothetical protein